jgi:formylglycine-generating enzyme required for sulfatase activity
MKRIKLTFILLLFVLPACAAVELDAAAVPVIDTGVDAASWAAIPAGEYLEGQFDHEADIAYDYEIMVTHVTNAQYADFLNAALAADAATIDGNAVTGFYPGDTFGGHKHELEIAAGPWELTPVADPASRLSFDGTTFTVMPGYENHPMTMVSWFGAWSYCRTYGGRLPTDAEWEKAARGTDNRPFPWGDEIDEIHANFSTSHDPFEDTSNTTPVGFYNGTTYDGYATSDAASPYGVYDMAGNVWEWTGDIHEGTHNRSLRGGSHTNYGFDLRIWSHNNADPRHVSPSAGFRCVTDS